MIRAAATAPERLCVVSAVLVSVDAAASSSVEADDTVSEDTVSEETVSEDTVSEDSAAASVEPGTTEDTEAADQEALGNALALARLHGARITLLHVEEDVTSQVYGSMASTAEVEAGSRYLERIVMGLRRQGLRAEAMMRYSTRPREEIVRIAREVRPDLMVMGAHGHKGLKDIIFGTTINAVRHRLRVPILVVREKD